MLNAKIMLWPFPMVLTRENSQLIKTRLMMSMKKVENPKSESDRFSII